MSERGRYVVIEGADGTGKSTQVARLKESLGALGIRSIEVHEPDGAEGVTGATELRKIIKDSTIPRDPWTNVLLFTAARRLNWLQAMQPALNNSVWVVAARSWISTVAYQGYGQGIDIEKIRSRTLEDVGPEYLNPDLELILTLEEEAERKGRIDGRGALDKPDTFESLGPEFQNSMKDGYTRYARSAGIEVISARDTKDVVQELIWERVKPLLPPGVNPQS